MPDEDSVEYTLLENGLDFIRSAVEHLSGSSTKRELKYAVLHLASGIELVLKERLRREDWKLLFEKMEQANDVAYRTGSFRSVKFDECLDRLGSHCDIWVEGPPKQRLTAIRDKRNRLEHLAIVDSAEAIISSATLALEVVVDFIRDELNDQPLSADEEELLTAIRTKLGELEAFVKARQESLGPKLKEAYAILPCPTCLQKALAIDDGVTCLFCGYKNSSDGAADDYATEVLGASRHLVQKEGAEWPVGFCPRCDWQACVDADDQGYLCFGCGGRWELEELTECGHCGRWMEQGDINICDDCFREQVNRPD